MPNRFEVQFLIFFVFGLSFACFWGRVGSLGLSFCSKKFPSHADGAGATWCTKLVSCSSHLQIRFAAPAGPLEAAVRYGFSATHILPDNLSRATNL